jgi:hypothetical protein
MLGGYIVPGMLLRKAERNGVFKKLNSLLHAPLRLAIFSLLVSVEEADFNYLLEQTESIKGNLSIQLTKLKDAG